LANPLLDFDRLLLIKHRATLPPPTDGWKHNHDDSYYRTAIEKAK